MGQCGADILHGQTQVVGDVLPRHRQLDAVVLADARHHVEEETGDPFARGAAAERQSMIVAAAQAARGHVPQSPWKEGHKFKITGAPVTDRSNAGKPGNAVELKAVRWRLLPMPWFIMLPLVCIIIVLLGSGATDLHVANAFQGDDGAYYVLGTKPDEPNLNVHLAWTAPFYSVLKFDKTDQGHVSAVPRKGDSASDPATVIEYGQAQRVTYEIGSKFFGSTLKADVRLVPLRSQEMLQLLVDGNAVKGAAAQDTIGEEHVPVTARDVTVMVPKSGLTTIAFRNLTGVSHINGQQIVAWTVRKPAGFTIQNFLTTEGDNQVVNPASSVAAKIGIDSSSLPPEGESTWELLTTDGTNQLLRIKLKVAGQ